MKFKVEIEEVLERLAGDGADRALANFREHRVQQLAEKRRTYARGAVYRPRHEFSFSPENKRQGTHARMTEPQTTHTVDCASRGMLSVSIISLKKSGTCTLSSCDGMTLAFRSADTTAKKTDLATDEETNTQDDASPCSPIIPRPYVYRKPAHNGPIPSALLGI
jgi:hypothetical protein